MRHLFCVFFAGILAVALSCNSGRPFPAAGTLPPGEVVAALDMHRARFGSDEDYAGGNCATHCLAIVVGEHFSSHPEMPRKGMFSTIDWLNTAIAKQGRNAEAIKCNKSFIRSMASERETQSIVHLTTNHYVVMFSTRDGAWIIDPGLTGAVPLTPELLSQASGAIVVCKRGQCDKLFWLKFCGIFVVTFMLSFLLLPIRTGTERRGKATAAE